MGHDQTYQPKQIVVLAPAADQEWRERTRGLLAPANLKIYVTERNNKYCLQFSQRRELAYTYLSYYHQTIKELVDRLKALLGQTNDRQTALRPTVRQPIHSLI